MESTVTVLHNFVTRSLPQNSGNLTTRNFTQNVDNYFEIINTTSGIYENQETYPNTALSIIFTIVSLILGITGILCGSVVLFVMLCTKSTRTLSSAFLINLVCSDLLLCAIAFPAVVLDMKKSLTGGEKRIPDGVPCQLLGFLMGVFSYNSVLSLCVIALDRYQAIVNCLEYTTYTTYKRVSRGLAFCWIQSIGWSIAPVLGWGSIAYKDSRFMCVPIPNYSRSYTIVLFLTQFVVVVIIMSVCYIKIIKIARRHARRICDINSQVHNRGQATHRMSNIPQIDPGGMLAFALVDPVKRLSLFPEFVGNQNGLVQHGVGQNVDVDYHSSGSNASNTGTNLHKEARATIKLLGLVLVFAFTWIQIHIVNLTSFFSDVNKTYESFAFLLACSNSCCNPVMYILASRRFRHNLRKRLNYCFKFSKRAKKPNHSSDKRNKIARQMASLYTNSKPNGAANTTTRDGQASNFDASVVIHPIPSDSTSNSPKMFTLDGSPRYLSQESLSKVEPSTTAGGDLSPRITKKKRKKKRTAKKPKYLKKEINNYMFNDAHAKQSNSNISLQKINPLPPIGVKT